MTRPKPRVVRPVVQRRGPPFSRVGRRVSVRASRSLVAQRSRHQRRICRSVWWKLGRPLPRPSDSIAHVRSASSPSHPRLAIQSHMFVSCLLRAMKIAIWFECPSRSVSSDSFARVCCVPSPPCPRPAIQSLGHAIAQRFNRSCLLCFFSAMPSPADSPPHPRLQCPNALSPSDSLARVCYVSSPPCPRVSILRHIVPLSLRTHPRLAIQSLVFVVFLLRHALGDFRTEFPMLT